LPIRRTATPGRTSTATCDIGRTTSRWRS
jgi:hypothetical protein